MIARSPSLVQLPELRSGQPENEVTAFHHRLQETGLFSDDNLIRIIDTHPREFCNVSTMGTDTRRYEWGEGDTTGLDGAKLLQAVKNGRLWLNIRRLERYQPEVWSVVEQLYAELQQRVPGFVTSKRSGNLLVSSPTAFVYYHLDVPQNILWHIRGRKRVWVYPVEAPYINREILEATVAGERVEDLPYHEEFDAAAQVFDMRPGDVVMWPQNSPHRVENADSLNVSLSTEHYTRGQLRHVRVCRANRLLRTLKLPCRSMETRNLSYMLKSSLFLGVRAMQKILHRRKCGYEYPMTFRVDLTAPNCIGTLDSTTAQGNDSD